MKERGNGRVLFERKVLEIFKRQSQAGDLVRTE